MARGQLCRRAGCNYPAMKDSALCDDHFRAPSPTPHPTYPVGSDQTGYRPSEPQPTAAQTRYRSIAMEGLLELTKTLDSVDTCSLILGFIQARDGLSPVDLDDLGNRISRYAWSLQR